MNPAGGLQFDLLKDQPNPKQLIFFMNLNKRSTKSKTVNFFHESNLLKDQLNPPKKIKWF